MLSFFQSKLFLVRWFFFKTVTQISNYLCLAEYAGVDVAGTQTATGLGPDYTNRQDAFDKVNFTGFYWKFKKIVIIFIFFL